MHEISITRTLGLVGIQDWLDINLSNLPLFFQKLEIKSVITIGNTYNLKEIKRININKYNTKLHYISYLHEPISK